VDIRLDALMLMRKFEAAKVSQPTTRTAVRETRDRKEARREYAIGQRRFQYIAMTHKLPPQGWDSATSTFPRQRTGRRMRSTSKIWPSG
jgi:hypothetical protein